MIIILAWLGILFTTLGVVAGDFFSVNLSSIAHGLHISDTLAGVTFLALGNGSPDIFSTFAAMNSNSPSMAIGELVGAAAFITSVVAGSMALVRPFSVVKIALVRDILFLTITVGFLLYILVDGHLELSHCICMLGFYVAYVLFVMGWHWWLFQHPTMTSEEDPNEDDSSNEEHARLPPTESTPLFPEICSQRSAPIVTSQYSPASRDLDRKSKFWHDWSDEATHHFEHRSIQPSLVGTLHFRSHESNVKRYNEAVLRESSGRATTSDGIRQRPTEEQYHSSHRFHNFTSKFCPPLKEVHQVLFPSFQEFKSDSVVHKLASVVTAPVILVVKLTLPVVDDDGDKSDPTGQAWHRWLLLLQGFCAPQFMLAVLWYNTILDNTSLIRPSLICLACSTLFAVIIPLTTTSTDTPRWYKLLSLVGFVISITWISTIADEAVTVLKALGIICNISEAVLGFTIFAVGNSLDDLAANISVAQHRHPVMALSACFGGPLLNILLGISISGIYIITKGSSKHKKLISIKLDTDQTLYITIGILVVALTLLLLWMLWTRWRMTKALGLILIAVWIVGTAANLVLTTV